MRDVTRILSAIARGDASATDTLLPVCGKPQLRAGQTLPHGPPGQTLQPITSVHESYLQPVGDERLHREGRGHVLATAAGRADEGPCDLHVGAWLRLTPRFAQEQTSVAQESRSRICAVACSSSQSTCPLERFARDRHRYGERCFPHQV